MLPICRGQRPANGQPWPAIGTDPGIAGGGWRTWKLESSVPPWDRLPIIAVVGALFYDEQVPPTLFAGAALIFLGIWLTLRGGTSAPQGQAVTKP